MAQILICDDDLTFQLACKQVLIREGAHHTQWAKNSGEASLLLRKVPFDLLLLDIEMRSKDEGLEFLPWLRENYPLLPVVICSGRSDFESVKAALKEGAWDYLKKDSDPGHLIHVVSSALKTASDRSHRELAHAEIRRSESRDQILGDSPVTRQLREKLEKFKRSEAPVLIVGETGTGKELAARSLRPLREDGTPAPFVAVDSATITESTAESILFGHEKGAFTGADRPRAGLFEYADGGVIFFDELANMPMPIQQKLLRVLQEKEVRRMGSERPLPLRFRVVAATNQDLEELCRQGRFQADLIQRLNVLPLVLPPLRERIEDLPILTEAFLKRSRGARRIQISDAALELLKAYSWPGNIRELQNVIEYAVTMTEATSLEPGDLPERIRASSHSKAQGATSPTSLYDQVIAFEKKILEEALRAPYSSVTALAERLGMDRSHLYTKLRQHGLKA
jgi:DNA-binding NtrC family response regulator